MSSRSDPKRPASSPGGRPKAGTADRGKTVTPERVRDKDERDRATTGKPRTAPAPGVPMSEQEYERLKERARVGRTPPSKHEQEDPARKK